jgi:hypothetical protein
MRKVIWASDKSQNILVENDAEDIQIFQEDSMVMIFNERQARKIIKAIRKSAKELDWKV